MSIMHPFIRQSYIHVPMYLRLVNPCISVYPCISISQNRVSVYPHVVSVVSHNRNKVRCKQKLMTNFNSSTGEGGKGERRKIIFQDKNRNFGNSRRSRQIIFIIKKIFISYLQNPFLPHNLNIPKLPTIKFTAFPLPQHPGLCPICLAPPPSPSQPFNTLLVIILGELISGHLQLFAGTSSQLCSGILAQIYKYFHPF